MSKLPTRATRRVVVVDESELAKRIGERIREARTSRGLSQRQLAGERFTGQYISSLERGSAKPSMAAINYLAPRLGVTVNDLLDPTPGPWSRVEADLMLASGDVRGASDSYRALAAEAPSPTARAEALLGLAEALCRQNQGAEAIRHASEALELFSTAKRPIDAAWASYWLASAQFQTDNGPEARAILDGLLKQVRDGLQVEVGFKLRLLTSLAAVAGWSGEHQIALAYLEEGRDLIDALDPRVQAAYFFSLAQNYKSAGDLEAAVGAGVRSLALYEGLGARMEVSVLHNHLALTYLKLGNNKRAAKFATQAAAEAAALGDPQAQAWVAQTQAEIALATGDDAAALELAGRALALEAQGASADTVLDAHITIARAHRRAGDNSATRTAFEHATNRARTDASATRRRQVLAEFADFLTEIGDEREALALYRDAVA